MTRLTLLKLSLARQLELEHSLELCIPYAPCFEAFGFCLFIVFFGLDEILRIQRPRSGTPSVRVKWQLRSLSPV